ncbi:unnamed protein product [Clonostachys byssicola]|uniref:Uncharacterized protein n=1 Tax=Clonostachys byssicola TaxID=160290 RepID=A0A9N9UHF9_9HYPO|nr:unnamed protein product [Clonostachys byssicola]
MRDFDFGILSHYSDGLVASKLVEYEEPTRHKTDAGTYRRSNVAMGLKQEIVNVEFFEGNCQYESSNPTPDYQYS